MGMEGDEGREGGGGKGKWKKKEEKKKWGWKEMEEEEEEEGERKVEEERGKERMEVEIEGNKGRVFRVIWIRLQIPHWIRPNIEKITFWVNYSIGKPFTETAILSFFLSIIYFSKN